MSLLKDLQNITERTYGTLLNVNLEEFVIGRHRFEILSNRAQSSPVEFSNAARFFFRFYEQNLYMAIYYSNALIRTLETYDPRRGLHDKNIDAFMIFIEEINHGVHAALKFSTGQNAAQTEAFVRDLELLAKIDTYQVLKFFLAFFNSSKKLEKMDRLWLRHHLFVRSAREYHDYPATHRYRQTNRLGEKYARFLDCLPAEQRLSELRRFRAMDYPVKVSYIRMLP